MKHKRSLLLFLSLLIAQSDMAAMSWFRSGLHGGWQRLQQARQSAGRYWDDQIATRLRSGALKVGDILTSLKEHSVCVAQGNCTPAERRRIGIALIALGTAMTMLGVAAKLRSQTPEDQFFAMIRQNDPQLSEQITTEILATQKIPVLNRAERIIKGISNYTQRFEHLFAIQERRNLLQGKDSLATIIGSIVQPPPLAPLMPGPPLAVRQTGIETVTGEVATVTPDIVSPTAESLRGVKLRSAARERFTSDENALISAAENEELAEVKALLARGLDKFSMKAIEIAAGKAAESDNQSLRRALINARTEKKLLERDR